MRVYRDINLKKNIRDIMIFPLVEKWEEIQTAMLRRGFNENNPLSNSVKNINFWWIELVIISYV